ncbi:MAG: kynureninase [Xanthomonadales bacterium]|nr:kynureninase [Xanthomonadales bacterium]
MTDTSLQHAQELDHADPLQHWPEEFWIPPHTDGQPQAYFAGNSLGLQPKRLEREMLDELGAWRDLGVEGHFKGERPWMPYHELLRVPLARLVGAKPSEVVAMNSLTVNLHLLMVSFFRPDGRRRKILIERQPFPSDRYAVASQLRFHGLDPDECLLQVGPRDGRETIEEEDIEAMLQQHGDEIALVLWPGVHYATGQAFDLARIAKAARAAGAAVGFDLAHAAGNLPLALHDSGCDFATWCSYKYLNSGAGAVAGAFVHERHHGRDDLPRLHGWWGHDKETRFLMGPEFVPAPGVDAWQLSNPPIYAMVPLRVSLQLFDEAGMATLREKSLALTGYFRALVRARLHDRLQVITPAEPDRHGCQLSLRVRAGRDAGRALFEGLTGSGVITDWREPDIIRAAPVPLYNRYEDCWRFVDTADRLSRDA